jgi:hypothetical protein
MSSQQTNNSKTKESIAQLGKTQQPGSKKVNENYLKFHSRTPLAMQSTNLTNKNLKNNNIVLVNQNTVSKIPNRDSSLTNPVVIDYLNAIVT